MQKRINCYQNHHFLEAIHFQAETIKLSTEKDQQSQLKLTAEMVHRIEEQSQISTGKEIILLLKEGNPPETVPFLSLEDRIKPFTAEKEIDQIPE